MLRAFVVFIKTPILFFLFGCLFGIYLNQTENSFFLKNSQEVSFHEFDTFKEVSPLLRHKKYELFISSIYLGNHSRIRDKKNVFLRLSFDENNVFDIGRLQNWNIKRGQQVLVNQKILIESSFFRNDKRQFSIELMNEQDVWSLGKTEVSILRCRTSIQDLGLGNSSFECSVPGEKTSVINYSLIEKVLPVQETQINQIASQLNSKDY
jgi:hypothetical protein